jgi:hypothetical protein
MIRALVLAAAMLPGVARADGWRLYNADGSYAGRIERGSDGTLERFGPDGDYLGRYSKGRDGWDAFGPDGAYEGRISGEGERGLPAVIGGENAR